MAVQTMSLPPIFVDQTEFHADPVRRALSSLLNHKAGFFGDDVMEAEVGEDYTVTVSPGLVALPSPSEEYRGVFIAETTAPVSLPIDPPHATQDRRDALVAYAVPPVGDGEGSWVMEVRSGTPSGTPVAPAVPGALVLSEIEVPAEAASELPYASDARGGHGQVYIGGVVLSSEDRPEDVRAGTVWIDWLNGNVWAYEGFNWYPAGVPRFSNATERNEAYDNPRSGNLAITMNPYTLWCYTGSSGGWLPVGDTVRASHQFNMSGSIAAAGGSLNLTNSGGMPPGRNGGIATVSGQTFKLNREGRWAINVMVFSDSQAPGVTTSRLVWTGGPMQADTISQTGWRGSGFAGAGSLNHTLSWTGNVSSAQAALNMNVQTTWTTQTAQFGASFTAYVNLEYLGR